MDGIFTKKCITGMPEASNMKIIDMISRLVGALMDYVSDESKTCHIKTMFTKHIDSRRYLCEITKRGKWKEGELANVEERIRTFNRNGVSTFVTYQKSGICTLKWHVLDPIFDEMKRNRR